MADPFLCEIRLFACNFAVHGFAKTEGQILPISQNTAMFSLLGTYYGGNGVSTFALPDLRDKSPIGVGQGPGLPNYDIGQTDNVSTYTPSVVATAATPASPIQAIAFSGVPVNTRAPFLTLNYLIATAGIFPARP